MSFLAGINRTGLIAALMILGFGGGFAWFQLSYKPAKAAKTAAVDALSAAEQSVQDKRSEYANLDRGDTDRESVGKMNIAKRAIPLDESGDEAIVEVEMLAKRAGVTFTDVKVTKTDGAGGAAIDPSMAPTGPESIDLTVDAHATYTSLIMFIQSVQDLVDDDRGTVYVKGRLYSVVSLTIGQADDAQVATEEEQLPKGHLKFNLILRTYAEVPTTPQTSLPGNSVDGAAPVDPNAPAGTTPAGTTPADPNAAVQPGGAPAPTDTAANGAAPAPAGDTAPTTTTVPPGAS